MQQPSQSDAKLFAQRIISEFNFDKNLDLDSLAMAREELIQKYTVCLPYLDRNFLSNILSIDKIQVTTRLWEVIILDYIMKSPLVARIEHKDKGPDWKITLKNESEFYVETTCAMMPKDSASSEIHRVLTELKKEGKSSFGGLLKAEVKSRISNSISEKLKKHSEFIRKKQFGYILVVSYGDIPLFSTCDLQDAIKTICPLGPLILKLDVENPESPKIIKQYLEYQDKYPKHAAFKAMINTNIFGNEEFNWVSAILFSKVEACLLLEQAKNLPDINWGEQKNDFVLVHNPSALYPLSENVFNCATQVYIKNDKLLTRGKDIFS